MQRGILTLTPQDCQYSLQLIAQSPHQPPMLAGKLQQGAQSPAPAPIEMSEEEVEVIMDSLPMPDQQEAEQITNLRKQLQQFLVQLRQNVTETAGSVR